MCASDEVFSQDKRKYCGFMLAGERHKQQLSLMWDTDTFTLWAAHRVEEGDFVRKVTNRTGNY